jgi:hypothetical protein
MRAHLVNENYPDGAENDSNAPWNEKKGSYFTKVDLSDGEVTIIKNERIAKDDWVEIDREVIDPIEMESLLAEKLGLDFDQMQEENDVIYIESIIDTDEGQYNFETDHGNVSITLEELESLI